MSEKRVLDDADIKTTWRRSGTSVGLKADPDTSDTSDADGTDGDGTDTTDGDSGDSDTTDS